MDLNPGASALILERPEGTLETTQRPDWSVTVDIAKPVSGWVTVTRAFVMTAPLGSVTMPPNCPGSIPPGFASLSRDIGWKDTCSCGQRDVQEWFRLVLKSQLYLRERPAFGSHEGGDDGVFRYGREHTAIGKTNPLQCQRRSLIGLFVITKRGLGREVCQRAQVRVGLLYVHALEISAFCGRELHGSNSFDQDFARFALSSLKSQEGRIRFRATDRFLKRNEKLMVA